MANGMAVDPVGDGFGLAVERLARYNLEPNYADLRQAAELASTVLQSEDGAVPERAIELTVESVVIAAAMRSLYNEEPLTRPDVDRYVEFSRYFFNSLWHV